MVNEAVDQETGAVDGSPPGRGLEGRDVAEQLAELLRLTEAQAFAAGMTPAQWTALRYFAGANRFSRTVSAFAAYHATTRGTASQTIKSLVSRGLLQRWRDPSDGRMQVVDITSDGRTALAQDPLQDLGSAVASLSSGQQATVSEALALITGRLSRRHRNERRFGRCRACCHLCRCRSDSGETDRSANDTERPWCAAYSVHLSEEECDQICVNHLPGDHIACPAASSNDPEKTDHR